MSDLKYYRVVAGKHYGLCPEGCNCLSAKRNKIEQAKAKERKDYRPRLKKHIYQTGEVVPCAKDLLTFNQGDAIKFQLVDKGGNLVRDIKTNHPNNLSNQTVPNEVQLDSLGGMTVDELRKFADEEEIDLGNVTRKDDILKAIRAQTVAASASAGFNS